MPQDASTHMARIDGDSKMTVSDNDHRYVKEQSIYQLVRSRADESPDAICIEAPGRRALSYLGLRNQVESVVLALRALEIARNDRVALVLPNGPEMAAAFISVTAAATCAPLNPAYRSNEFEFYLSDLHARSLIVWSEMDSPAREVARKLNIPLLELKPTLSDEAGRFELVGLGQRGSNRIEFSRSDDTALVLHTSGTTSRPK